MSRIILVPLIFFSFLIAGCGIASETITVLHQPDSTFRDLDNYGKWVDVPDFGCVWKPYIKHNWQPYLIGQWAWTDQGWMWDSNEPFGWMVYHYGYWQYTDHEGWFWIPGYEWSPARVIWYYTYGATGSFETRIVYSHGFAKLNPTDGYVGWTPIPSPIADNSIIYNTKYASKIWVVVPEQYFVGQDVMKYLNTSYISELEELCSRDSRNIPDVKEIEQYSHNKIDVVKLTFEQINAGNRQLKKVKK